MSAQFKALTIQNGTTRRILDASSLEVGLGINSAAGQPLTIHSSDAVATNTPGFSISMQSGATDSGAGGLLGLYAGNANSGTSGSVELYSGKSTSGPTGSVTIGTNNGTAAGQVLIKAGAGSTAINGATLALYAGDVDGVGNTGGEASLLGGGATVSGTGGQALVSGGGSASGTGGRVFIVGGSTANAFAGSAVDVYGGDAGTVGEGGYATVVGGAGGTTSGAGGRLTLRAGPGSTAGVVGGNGGDVFVWGGQQGGTSTNLGGVVHINGGQADTTARAGQVFIGDQPSSTYKVTINSINLTDFRANGTTALQVYDDGGALIEVQPTAVLYCVTGGYIDLPGEYLSPANNFAIQGSHVNETVTATALNALTGGPAFDGDPYHTHPGLVPTSTPAVAISAAASEAIVIGAPVVFFSGTGPQNAKNGNASSPQVALSGDIIGLAVTAAAAPFDPVSIQTCGILTFSNASNVIFATPPAASDRGKRVYCDTTSGKLTLTPPSGNGNFVQKVGVLAAVAGSTISVNIQIGDMTILTA